VSPLLAGILGAVVFTWLVGVVAVYVVLCETIDGALTAEDEVTGDAETLAHGFFIGALMWPAYLFAFLYRVTFKEK